MRQSRKDIRIVFHPTQAEGMFPRGSNLLECARQLGLLLPTHCGGIGLCGKCRVRLVTGHLPVSVAERKWLTEAELKNGFRLACQAVANSDCQVEIPPAIGETKPEILAYGLRQAIRPDPAVRKISIRMEPHPLQDNAADLEALYNAMGLKRHPETIPLPLLRRLPLQLRQDDFSGTAVLCGHRLIDFESGDTRQHCYGLAVDVGTTTIVAKLYHLPSGRLIAVASQLNSQRAFGEDVISRIGYADTTIGGLSRLQEAVLTDLQQLISEVTKQANIDRHQIYHLVLAGNTVMQHLLLGVSPRALATLPYVPVFRSALRYSAADLTLSLHPQAEVWLFPIIGRFVGGDTAAVLLTLANRLRHTWLAIDIGTNGEIILCHKGRLWATSAAAGPAFEGARIRYGMRAAAGAIDRVFWHDNRLETHVIGQAPPQGICGSGLIDAIGCLLQAGALDESGRLQPEHPLVIKKVITDIPLPADAYPLVCLAERSVYLTQRDIREAQLAKSAIATAVKILLQVAEITVDRLQAIYLAGAFGQYLRSDMALKIGLLPPVAASRIVFIGNAAAAGAELALLSTKEYQRAKKLAAAVEYVEIATHSSFQELFAENLMFNRP